MAKLKKQHPARPAQAVKAKSEMVVLPGFVVDPQTRERFMSLVKLNARPGSRPNRSELFRSMVEVFYNQAIGQRPEEYRPIGAKVAELVGDSETSRK